MSDPFSHLASAQYYSGEDVAAEFHVPPTEASSFALRLKMAFGVLGVNTSRGRSDSEGNVIVGARLRGAAAERFLERCPASKLDR